MTSSHTANPYSPVYLLDVASNQLMPAELHEGISDKHLADWEAEWKPELELQLKALNQANVERTLWPQSRHWDWSEKKQAIESRLSDQCFALVCGGVTQAMMITNSIKRCRLEAQYNQHLVYVEFIESAPWNRRTLVSNAQRYKLIGSVMLAAAIDLSIQEGFKGRIGLHSLPQANQFYADRIGMRDCGPDFEYQGDLRYFEMTPEDAKAFIAQGEM